jgi:hypothetical protein
LGRAAREASRLEGRIAVVEREVAEVEAALADPAVAGDRAALAEHAERHRVLQEELSWLMLEWERMAEAAASSG